ncbi:MAG: hypothetical protein AMJ92_11735 [candidate division Zixibacteria bacterium SM23_81]|nr:MAG: hypothetical protein AMJ92_11735 [candidate division Zixibacteria bacterium SM23_81]
MYDQQCVKFLRWSLPQLNYKWQGFRKVRRQVCRRLKRRLEELSISNISGYKDYLSKDQKEWVILDSLLYISISRFYRDREIFDLLKNEILLLLAQRALEEDREVRCWSAGCCSGEEAYSLQIMWIQAILPRLKSQLRLHVIASDKTSSLLERAKKGIYPEGSVRDLPQEFIQAAFLKTDNGYEIKNYLKTDIEFIEQDIRHQCPEGIFDLILCRNLAFTYFEEDLQRAIIGEVIEKLEPNGFFIVGSQESIPSGIPHLSPYWKRSIYRKIE